MLLFPKYRVLTDRQWWACSAGPRQHFVLWSAEVPPNLLLRLLRGVPLGSTLREYSQGVPLGSTLRKQRREALEVILVLVCMCETWFIWLDRGQEFAPKAG